MTPESDLPRYFGKKLGWGKSPQSKRVYDLLIKAAEHCSDGVVLDAAAGHQRYRPFFFRSLYLSMEHPAGIEMKRMDQIPCDLIGEVDRFIPLQDECVDAILSTAALEHLRYPAKFFEESFRILKPGGALFINVPFVYNEHEVPYDFNRPTRYGMQRWYEDCGFVDISVRPSSSSIFTATGFMIYATNECGETYANIPWRLGLRYLVLKVFGLMTRIVCRSICYCLDHEPYDSEQFPVGWVAVGRKPGNLVKAARSLNREDFLEKYRIGVPEGSIKPQPLSSAPA